MRATLMPPLSPKRVAQILDELAGRLVDQNSELDRLANLVSQTLDIALDSSLTDIEARQKTLALLT